MSRTRSKPTPRETTVPRLVIIAGVLLLVGALFLLKEKRSATESAGLLNEAAGIATADSGGSSQPAATLASIEATTLAQPAAAGVLLPEDQLDEHLAAGRPVLAFFHSNTCAQCIRMTEIVAQVYPDYADSVALVDVNVYDQRNRNLLGRVGIQVIPTLIFIDRDQQGQGYTGVMPAETLREQLELLRQER